MSKEAMKLAWEAEEKANPQTRYNSWCRGYEAALREALAKPDFWEGYVPEPDSTCNNTLRAQGKAYPRTCKKCGLGPCVGLAQQALDKKAENARELGLDYEPAQEPVAFLANGTRFKISYDSRQSGGQIHGIAPELAGRWVAFVAADDDCHLKLASPQPAQQEPVAYLCENAVGHKYFRWKKPSSTYKPIALYTSPPAQRTWVGLTDEEELQLAGVMDKSRHWLVAAVEAKLKEKNT